MDAGRDFIEKIDDLLSSRDVQNIDQFNETLDAVDSEFNRTPLEELHGLSPAQMWKILGAPFESPDIAEFSERVDKPESVSVLLAFGALVEAIGKDGARPTAEGNLPQSVVRHVEERVHLLKGRWATRGVCEVKSEADFKELYVLRFIAMLAGLIREYDGRFVVTIRCRQVLDIHGLGGAYYPLFRAFVTQFDWGVNDVYVDSDLPKRSWLFTLYLLYRYGGNWRNVEFYGDAFERAFPPVISDTDEPSRSVILPERDAKGQDKLIDPVRSNYRLQVLSNFAEYLGLAEETGTSGHLIFGRPRLRATPLLHNFVTFHIP